MLRPAVKILALLLIVQCCAPSLLASSDSSSSLKQSASQSSERTTTARSGDTIRKIARRFGISASELAERNNLGENSRIPKGTKIYLPDAATSSAPESGEIIGNTITLADGYTFQADAVWRQGDEVWYRKGNITSSLPQAVKSVTPIVKPRAPAVAPSEPDPKLAVAKSAALPVWIYLVDGAKFRVDEVQETSDGAWYNRGLVSSFLEKERIARIEREEPNTGSKVISNHGWTSGNPTIDQLIRTNGTRFGVDPYLVFLVIEKESRFRVRALSPKGAQGLMQLMPGTARRLGVRRPFDAAENIRGGTQYLRELMDMFGGQVNLVLASYNAGEGAVLKYGRNVPPYRETRDYVKTIGKRYGLSGRSQNADSDVPSPQR
jgi:soluble lytic murein transglycosylase-like protein